MTIRDNFIIQKLGTLMLANADLAAENVALAQKCQEKTATIADLEAKLETALQNQPMASGAPHANGSSELMATAGAGGLPAGVGSGGGDTKTH